MKNSILEFAAKSTYVFVLVVVTIAIGLGMASYVLMNMNRDLNQDRTYTVSGSAKRSVVLDTADINFGVVIQGKTAEEVQRQATEKYNNATEAIKKLGIEEKNIQTQNYNVMPTRNPETGDIDGYEINLGLKVKVTNTNPKDMQVGKIISTASENGFNNVNNVNFYLSDYKKVQDDIKEEAIKDAKARAQKESAAADLKLGKLMNVYTDMYGGPEPYYAESSNAVGGYAADAKEAMPTIEFQPGETEVEVNVNLEYEIVR